MFYFTFKKKKKRYYFTVTPLIGNKELFKQLINSINNKIE